MCNVSIASEMKMRKRPAEMIGDNLKVEPVPLTFPLREGGEEVKLRPYISLTFGYKLYSCLRAMRGKFTCN